MNKKDNRRKNYTRRVIRESFLVLLIRKPLPQITVKEICEVADINRATFYAFYDGIQALKESLEDELIQDLEGLKSLIVNSDLELTKKTMSLVLAKKELCQALLGPNNTDLFAEKIVPMFREIAFEKYRQAGIDEQYYEMIYVFLTSGSLGIIKDWMQNDCKTPPEDIIRLLQTMYTNCINGFSPKAEKC